METAFRSEERFTQREFRDWLERLPSSDINHYELIRGQIVMSPPASWGHGSLDAWLSHELLAHVDDAGLGRVFGSSTGFELPSGDTLEPDCAFVSKERWNAAPRTPPDSFLPMPPDLAIEILSPSTARRDKTEKLEIYAENGVREYWLVDPKKREVSVYALTGATFSEPLVVARGDVPCSVLPGLRVDVESLFSLLDS